MIRSQDALRSRYRLSDFLFYTCLLAVPAITAVLAILRHSVGWTILYIALAAAAAVVVLRLYCTRCPHYTREEQRLKCIFFWGVPKFFPARPGPLNWVDKTAAFGAAAVAALFPLYWLLMSPGLLVVFALSAAGFTAAVRRNECHRCIYFECPANAVPDAIKSDTGWVSGSRKK